MVAHRLLFLLLGSQAGNPLSLFPWPPQKVPDAGCFKETPTPATRPSCCGEKEQRLPLWSCQHQVAPYQPFLFLEILAKGLGGWPKPLHRGNGFEDPRFCESEIPDLVCGEMLLCISSDPPPLTGVGWDFGSFWLTRFATFTQVGLLGK